MSKGPLVVLGDTMLDIDMEGMATRVCPDSPPGAPAPVIDCSGWHDRPGGAGLAALIAAHRDGRDVVLVTSVGDDEAGRRICEMLCGLVDLITVPLRGRTPQKIRVRADSDLLLRVDLGRGKAAAPAEATQRRVLAALRSASAVLVSDYGRGLTAQPAIVKMLMGVTGNVPVVWDPHPKGAAPVPGICLATPNESEAARFAPRPAPGQAVRGRTEQCRSEQCRTREARSAPGSVSAAGARASRLARRWAADGVAVTLGARGAVLAMGDRPPLLAPAPRVRADDTCGAGDSFAAAAAHAIADGGSLVDAVVAGVGTAARFVAAGAASGIRFRAAPPVPVPVGSTARPRRGIVALAAPFADAQRRRNGR